MKPTLLKKLIRKNATQQQSIADSLHLKDATPEGIYQAILDTKNSANEDLQEHLLTRLYCGDPKFASDTVFDCLNKEPHWHPMAIHALLKLLSPKDLEATLKIFLKQSPMGFDIVHHAMCVLDSNVLTLAADLLAKHHLPKSIYHCIKNLDLYQNENRNRCIKIILQFRELFMKLGSKNQKILKQNVITKVEPLLKDEDSEVCRMAFVALAHFQAPQCRMIAIRFLTNKYFRMRETAIQWYGQNAKDDELHLIVEKLGSEHPKVVLAARKVIADLWPKRQSVVRLVLPCLEHKNEDVVLFVIEQLAKNKETTHLTPILELIEHENSDIAVAALKAAVALDPDNRFTIGFRGLKHVSKEVVELACAEIKDTEIDQEKMDQMLDAICNAQFHNGSLVLERIADLLPGYRQTAINRACDSKVDRVRLIAVELMDDEESDDNLKNLKRLVEDINQIVRKKAFLLLKNTYPTEAKRLAPDMLDDDNFDILSTAFELLEGSEDPSVLEKMLTLTRDADWSKRKLAIRVISDFDDERAGSELLSSVHDVVDGVSGEALKLLKGDPPPKCMTNLLNIHGDSFLNDVLKAQEDVNRWASHIGFELLGRTVMVQNYRQGLGRTRRPDPDQPVEIEISDAPVTSGHQHGKEIMQGLALHEIGHHIFHIGVRGERTMSGIARSEGIDGIYQLLQDEQLERGLRSRRPLWGHYFDRLASYAFAQNNHDLTLTFYSEKLNQSIDETRQAVKSDQIPGKLIPGPESESEDQVRLTDHELLSVPGLMPVLMAFTACLRCGFNPDLYPDTSIRQAINLIPANLKDLKPNELLEVARKIGKLLGNSRQFKKEWKELQQTIKEQRSMLKNLSRAINRLLEAGMVPGEKPEGAAGIRKTTNQPQSELLKKEKDNPGYGKILNRGKRLDFDLLVEESSLDFDASKHAMIVGYIRKHIRRLRSHFARLGMKTIEQYASSRGNRLDMGQLIPFVVSGSHRILVHTFEEQHTSAYIGILIDRSGSMVGRKLELAKAFGILISESLKDIPGVAGHINAFDHSQFIKLGDFRRNAIASLSSDGGNNDAGGLYIAAKLALASGKQNKMIIMISDGSPTECTVSALRNLVKKLGNQAGVVCAQVAVEKLEEIAFPHYLDLSRYQMDEAVWRFGKLVKRLTMNWK